MYSGYSVAAQQIDKIKVLAAAGGCICCVAFGDDNVSDVNLLPLISPRRASCPGLSHVPDRMDGRPLLRSMDGV